MAVESKCIRAFGLAMVKKRRRGDGGGGGGGVSIGAVCDDGQKEEENVDGYE
jgi:hypothetical protein